MVVGDKSEVRRAGRLGPLLDLAGLGRFGNGAPSSRIFVVPIRRRRRGEEDARHDQVGGQFSTLFDRIETRQGQRARA